MASRARRAVGPAGATGPPPAAAADRDGGRDAEPVEHPDDGAEDDIARLTRERPPHHDRP